MATDQIAPGDLELVRSFVNTYDAEDDVETLTSPAALSAWLTQKELGGGRLHGGDLARTIDVREALRDLMLANNSGEAPPPTAVTRLNRSLAGATLEVRFETSGRTGLEPTSAGIEGALARIAAIVREATASGEWARLKVCPADDCQWAFYDRSRNGSRTWCSMEVCGNRSKVRTFRERSSDRS